MGYFASRAAALGPVSAQVVTATFYNFHPGMVRRSIPDAWSFSTPERVLEARLEVVDWGLRRALGDRLDSPEVARAAEIAWPVVEAADISGRPLFAAHRALPRAEAAHLSLWQATTCLREHRGDGHVATLVAEDVGGLEAHVLIEAAGVIPGDMQRDYRGWSKDEWGRSVEGLREKGILDPAGSLTAKGAALRDRIEGRTDELALAPWVGVGAAAYREFVELMTPLTEAILASDMVPFPNPMGLTRPALSN